MRYEHLIWDFDGTLFDTYGEISKVIEQVLVSKGINEDYILISQNLHKSLTHTLQLLSEKHNLDYMSLVAKFMEAEEKMNVQKALPFEGVENIIQKIKGYNFIVTNRGASVFRFLESKDYLRYFEEILYRDSGFPLKPNSASVDYLVEKYSLDRKRILFIGDRDVDIECAINAGIDSCYYDSHDILNIAPCTYYVKKYFDLEQILITS
ncbi:MAG TPA: HAD-IA family hydrolase [Clostridia bacterium]|nr:HAD-IA family hydrolase [Clostridia bacterium]